MTLSLHPKQLHFVHTDQVVRKILPILDQHTHLCVDTEFHAENRYTPKLMLIQISDLEQNTWVIDPLSCDITPLKEVLQSKTLIMHGSKEDILLLQKVLCVSHTNVIDVQIAASMMGSYYPTRLSSIIEEHLGIETPQHQTLTDWSKRPLSEEQIRYAAEDASALVPLYLHFSQALKERYPLLLSICSEFAHHTLSPQTKQQDWLQWGVTKTLSNDALSVLAELITWRESQAQLQNKPPNYILPRNIAVDIARRQPGSIQALRQNRRINSVLIKKHGQKLLNCIQKGQQSAKHYAPFSTQELRYAHVIQTWAQAISQKTNIDANLLVPQNLAMRIVRQKEQALDGWRKDLLFDELVSFIQGSSSLILDGQNVILSS